MSASTSPKRNLTSSGVPDLEKLDLDGPILSEEDRRRIMSSMRLKVALISMVVLIIALLAGTIFLLVSNIFDSLTPALRHDLAWKAQRGAAELSGAMEMGVAAEDRDTIAAAGRHHRGDADVLGMVVVGDNNKELYEHGNMPIAIDTLFANPAGNLVEDGLFYAAWEPIEIEGLEVGRVALAISTQRLAAGMELRRTILTVGVIVALFALLAALAFVNLYIVPLTRVTERAFGQLERTTEMALESARLKSQFLANMSHEIRTPMNGVLGMTRLILNTGLEPKLRRYIETVDASGRALMTIINDILDFSKIESGKYEIHEVEFDISVLTQEVVELFAERAHVKGLELLCRVAPDVPTRVHADPDRVRQVLGNLIGNAIKFTEEGEIYVQVTRGASDKGEPALLVEVHDTGIGIPEASHETIFESFSQQDGSSVRVYGGTGLGLAISKHLIEIMKGKIGVKSEPGKGSVFHFSLPLVEAATVEQETRVIEPAGRRAIVVDSSDRARQIVAEHLRAWGMLCSELADADEALARIAEAEGEGEPFHIAVVAQRAGGMEGAQLLERLGKERPELPTVFLSQSSSQTTASELSESVVAQISKPIRVSDLYDSLVGTFAGAGRRHEQGQAQAVTPRQAPRKGIHILVVDDNEVNQFVAAEQVLEFGYEVGIASNGQEAGAAALTGKYAAVLMDCQMPVMDGYEATRVIREREAEGQRLPIIALTAHALLGERDKVLEAGMDDYLTKPIRSDALRKVLAHLVDANVDSARGETCERAEAQDPSLPDLETETRRSPKVIELVLRHVPTQVELLGNAIEAGDAAATRAHAHKLKGSAASIGARRMSTIAEELQHLGNSGDVGDAPQRMEALRASFEVVRDLLEGELQQKSAPSGASAPPQG